jgi:glycopeptide antibiotics resistance protein
VIFVLRVVIFSTLNLLGFYISTRSIRLRKIVTVIYTFAILWYTLLCRLPLFTSVPVAAESTIRTTPAKEQSFAESLIEAMIAIFGPQPDGTLAGDGVVRAMTFNALLFVPMGYLFPLWFHRLRKNPWLVVGICTVVSVGIELLQEWTGLGVADWKDALSNVLGGAVGVLIVKAFAVRSSSRDY